MNNLQIIYPYKYEGGWVFDDEKHGLNKEPFILGMGEIIDNLVSGIPNANKGFRATFSAKPFIGYMERLDWISEEMEGNWYLSKNLKTKGWLCAALLLFFEKAPKTLYLKAEF